MKFLTLITLLILVFHIPYAFFASKELIEYPILSTKEKILYLVFIWLVPYWGAKRTYKKIGVKVNKGSTSGGDPYTGESHGGFGDSSGDGGD